MTRTTVRTAAREDAHGHESGRMPAAFPRPRHPGNPTQPDLDPVLPYGRQGHPGNAA